MVQPPFDVLSYGEVILHVVNQEWPKPWPLHYVVTDSETEISSFITYQTSREDEKSSSRSKAFS